MRIDKLETIKEGISKLLQEAGQASPASPTGTQQEIFLPQGIGDFAGLSASKAALKVLKDAAGPLHISEIAKRMAERGYGDKEPRKLRVTLYTTLLRSKGFVKLPFPKATFALARWGSAETQAKRLKERTEQSAGQPANAGSGEGSHVSGNAPSGQ
jgi:hypothetical protein